MCGRSVFKPNWIETGDFGLKQGVDPPSPLFFFAFFSPFSSFKLSSLTSPSTPQRSPACASASHLQPTSFLHPSSSRVQAASERPSHEARLQSQIQRARADGTSSIPASRNHLVDHLDNTSHPHLAFPSILLFESRITTSDEHTATATRQPFHPRPSSPSCNLPSTTYVSSTHHLTLSPFTSHAFSDPLHNGAKHDAASFFRV